MKTILILIGLRGSGKSTLLKRAQTVTGVTILQPSTTRPPRTDDEYQYHYLNKEAWDHNEFAWTIEVQGHSYGLRKSQIEEIEFGEIGLTVFHPGNIEDLYRYQHNSSAEFITIGLNTIKTYAELKKRIGYDKQRDEGQSTFDAQLKIVQECDIVLEGDPDVLLTAITSIVRILFSRGVLDKQTIIDLINTKTLLKNTILTNVQSASYDLRVGSTVWCKGNLLTLKENETVAIPPYSYVLIKAEEEACLPKFIVAHYDIKVSLFIQGIILSNGPQVDPGFSGGLLCMLFNCSDTNVGLRRGEHFATIEFLVTSKTTEGYKEHYQHKDRLEEFMHSTTAVSTGGTIFDKFDKLQKSWETFRNTFIIGGIAVIIALIGISVGMIQWGYNTWDKVENVRKQIVDNETQLQELIKEEKKIKTEVDNAIVKLSEQQSLPTQSAPVARDTSTFQNSSSSQKVK
jgi:deoxycytidine triphosphate deaminase